MLQRWVAFVGLVSLGLGLTAAGVLGSTQPASAAAADYISISTTQLDFGRLRFGQPNVTMSYTVTALQDTEVSVPDWQDLDATSAYGQEGSGACAGVNGSATTFTMTAGQVCTVTVTINPNVSLAWRVNTGGGQIWDATEPGGFPTDSAYVQYISTVDALSWSPNILAIQTAPNTTSAPQTLTFTNEAVVPLSPLTLGGVTDPFTGDVGTCAAPIPAGGTCEMSFTYTSGDPGSSAAMKPYVNFSATGPSGPLSYTSTFGLINIFGNAVVTPPSADISITKTLSSDGPIIAGSLLEWTVTVANAGPDDAGSVQAYDFPGDGLTLESAAGAVCTVYPNATPPVGSAPGVPVGDGYTVCNLGPMASGASTTFTVRTRVAATTVPGTVLTNSASAFSEAIDDNPSNNVASVSTDPTAAVADLSLTKDATTAAPVVGSQLSWSVSAANAGPDDASDVVITDTLPAGLSFVSGPDGCTENAGTVSCAIDSLASGDDWDGTITTTIDDANLAGQTVANTATIAAAQYDPDSSNNSATAESPTITGAVIPPTPTPTPTSSPTPGPTATPTPAAGSGSEAPWGGSGAAEARSYDPDAGTLAYTGANPMPALFTAMLMLVGGAVLQHHRRRRGSLR